MKKLKFPETKFASREFVHRYRQENLKILRTAADSVIKGCKSLGFKYVLPNAGLFVWIYLGKLLPERSYAAERALFRYLIASFGGSHDL